MTGDECRDIVLTAIEKYWDERLPDRCGLDEFFDKFDTAVDHLIDEVDRREAEIDFGRNKGGKK
jgi:hypothetical protein